MRRSQRQLEDQKALIRVALRSALWDEDAYRVRGYRTPEEREVPLVLPARVKAGPGRPGRRYEAEYAATVCAVVDSLPRHLVLHLAPACAALSAQERLLLRLAVKLGHSNRQIADAFGWKRPARVRDEVERILGTLALWLWADDGHATLPPERGA